VADFGVVEPTEEGRYVGSFDCPQPNSFAQDHPALPAAIAAPAPDPRAADSIPKQETEVVAGRKVHRYDQDGIKGSYSIGPPGRAADTGPRSALSSST
jgi:hypothetical protein